MRSRLAVLLAIVSLVWFAGPAGAEEPLVSGHSGRAGIGFYRTDSWAQVGVTLLNRRTEAVELEVVIAVTDQPATQFASRVWIPAKAMRRVIVPVRTTGSSKSVSAQPQPEAPAGVPERLEPRNPAINTASVQPATAQVYEIKGDQRTLLFADSNDIQINADKPTTGVFADSQDDIPGFGLGSARVTAGLTPRLFFFKPSDSPSNAAGLASLDSLVFARSWPDLDGAQVAAIRQWLVRGGKLWVMLDRVSPEFMAQVLGEDWDVTVVDSVELSRVALEGAKTSWSRDFEKPILFTRTIPNGMEVMYTVDGWPAAYRKQVGRGTVLVTTLAANGWVNEDRSASPPLLALTTTGLMSSPVSPVPFESMTKAAMGQIGYRILGRGAVIAVLGGFCLIFAGGGLWFWRSGRLDLLAPSGAGLAAVTAAFFLLVGNAQRQVTPATLASQQFIEVVPSQRSAIVSSVVGIYSPTEKDDPLTGQQPEPLLPDFSSDRGRVHRLTYLDMDRWRWDGVTAQSGGVRTAKFSTAESLPKPVYARVRLTETGLQGKLESGPIEHLRGLVMASTSGWMLPQLESDGTFKAFESVLPQRGRPAGPPPRDEIDSRQRDVLTQLLGMSGYPQRPCLLGWSDGFDDGLSMGPEVTRRKGAVVSIPLQLETVAPGQRVTIPAMLMQPRPAGQSGGLLFDPLLRQWIASRLDNPNETVGFQVPAEAMPFQPESGRLFLDLTAPRRTVEVETFTQKGKPGTHIATLSSPAGLVSIPIPADAGLTADADGVIAVRLKFSPASAVTGDMVPMWNLQGAAMEVVGSVANRR